MAEATIETLLLAYQKAAHLLDVGMRRAGGATDAEWQQEDDARIMGRAARRVAVSEIVVRIDESQRNYRRLAAALVRLNESLASPKRSVVRCRMH